MLTVPAYRARFGKRAVRMTDAATVCATPTSSRSSRPPTLARARAFYEGVLGLDACSTTTASRAWSTRTAPRCASPRCPSGRRPTYTVLGWKVDDLDAHRSTGSSRRGVDVPSASTAWSRTHRGAWTAPERRSHRVVRRPRRQHALACRRPPDAAHRRSVGVDDGAAGLERGFLDQHRGARERLARLPHPVGEREQLRAGVDAPSPHARRRSPDRRSPPRAARRRRSPTRARRRRPCPSKLVASSRPSPVTTRSTPSSASSRPTASATTSKPGSSSAPIAASPPASPPAAPAPGSVRTSTPVRCSYWLGQAAPAGG